MVVSIVKNWDTMLASAQIVTYRLPRKTMVKGSDNLHFRHVMEVQILRSTRVNGITCMAVKHVTAEQAQDTPVIVLGTFPVNSVPATVFFGSEASHSILNNLRQRIIYL
jgi:hypothetical protein